MDAQAYLTGKLDQLEAALAHGDAATAEKVIDSIDGDGYPKTAAVIAAGLAHTSIGGQLAEEHE